MPEYSAAIKGYVINTIKANHWRVREIHEFEDLEQESMEVFLRLVSKYPLLDGPHHFMGLFKRAWSNRLNDLAVACGRARRCVPSSVLEDKDGDEFSREFVGELNNSGFLKIMIDQAPGEVKQVLSLFLNAPAELLEMATSSWKQAGRRNEEGEAFVSRMLGLPKGSQPLKQVAEYFDTGR